MAAIKATLKEGTTSIYPQTTEDMVFIEGDANNRTLKDYMREMTASGYLYAGTATPTTNPTTPAQKSYYLATTAGTYTNFSGIVVNAGEAAFLKYDPTAVSPSWVKENTGIPLVSVSQNTLSIGGEYSGEMGDVYDVTLHNSGATFASLEALLSDANLNTLIPLVVRKGGMKIKFVQTSDNKYIQARCMAQNFTTDVTQWQGVDEKPAGGSHNLVESWGVKSELMKITGGTLKLPIIETNGGFYGLDGVLYEWGNGKYAEFSLEEFAGSTLTVTIANAVSDSSACTGIYKNGSFVTYIQEAGYSAPLSWDIPENSTLRLSHNKNSTVVINVITQNKFGELEEKIIVCESELDENSKSINRLEQIVDNFNYINIIKESYNNEENKYVDSAGNLGTIQGLIATDYIEVEANQDYLFNSNSPVYFAWYNSNKEFISWEHYDGYLPADTVYTSPNTAKYIRFSCMTSVFENTYVNLFEETELNKYIKVSDEIYSKQFSENINKKLVQGFNSISFLSETAYVEGKYIAPSTGELGNISGFCASNYISINEETEYYLFGLGLVYGAFYNSNKVYISGLQYEYNVADGTKITSPQGAAYIRLSTQSTKFLNSSICNSISYELAPYIDFGKEEICYITKTIKPNGGGDFTTLSAAFDSITDSSYNKRYILEFYGDGNEYDTLIDKPYDANSVGLMVPAFTKLIGVGGKEKCILVRRLPENQSNDSLLNLRMTSELEGFTLIADKTRYVVHDDFGQSNELDNYKYVRHIKDVVATGTNLTFASAWGAGNRSGANWYFENCIFNNIHGAQSYSCHNNISFTNTTSQKFVNCRFYHASGLGRVGFGSLNTNANGINNIAEFCGCSIGSIALYEENASLYGSGILFKVTGFANNLKTGDADITITNTDEKDYSDNIDLI